DRPSARAVANAGGAVLLDVPADLEATAPVVVTLTGAGAEDLVWGHVVVRLGRHSKATIVLRHTGSARYAATTTV
ncbi:Fe-S cluster assembly protein SufD, partial [Nocardioides sp. SOB77]|nr:Fe-S cluster assembly protein SufD [Nocardioides oceani]